MQNWWLTKQLFFSQVGHFKKKYDVCLSYCDEDEGQVERICSMLQKVHAQIVIHRKQFTYNHEEVWQEEIFDIMIQSHKWVCSLGLPGKRARCWRLDPKTASFEMLCMLQRQCPCRTAAESGLLCLFYCGVVTSKEVTAETEILERVW